MSNSRISKKELMINKRTYSYKIITELAGLKVLQMRVSVRGKYYYSHLFKCTCGIEFIAEAASVKSGHTKSCGCLQPKVVSKKSYIHGQNNTSTYSSWENMIQRCTNPKATGWDYYGGRGISVCARWRSFKLFFEDMGTKPNGMSIDRINNDGNYEPGNCRWVTQQDQLKNRRPRGCYKKTK